MSRTMNANNAKFDVLVVVKGCQAGLVYLAVERNGDSSFCSIYHCTTGPASIKRRLYYNFYFYNHE